MANQTAGPVQIGYPPNVYGSGYNTNGAPSPTVLDPTTDADVAQVVAQGTLVNSQTQLVPIPTGINTCYRDVVLMGLFALRPFVGYVEQYVINNPEVNLTTGDISQRDQILRSIHRLLQEFWSAGTDINQKRKRLSNMATTFHTLFYSFGDNDPSVQDDAPLYVQAILQQLDPGFATDSSLRDVFAFTFWNQFVGRNAFECDCSQKSRETQHRDNDDRMLCPISISQDRPTIDDALAWSMYDRQGENEAQCPTCGKTAKQHRFLKYRYLPEILLLQLDFVATDDKGVAGRAADIRCTIPEELDLDALHDKVDRNIAQNIDDAAARNQAQRNLPNKDNVNVVVARDSRYKLQFVVDYSGKMTSKTSAGHYRCNMRGQNNQWFLLDGVSRRAVAKPTSLQEIETHKAFQPRLVAYVRQHGEDKDETHAGSKTLAKEDPKADDQVQSTEAAAQPGEQQPQNSPMQPALEIPAGYATWDIKRLKEAVSERGIALIAKRDASTLRSLLEKNDQNPHNYDLLTAKRLTEEIKKRGLFTEGKRAPLKKEMIKILVDHDQGSGLGTKQQPTTTVDDGHDNLKSVVDALKAEKAAWLKEKREMVRSHAQNMTDTWEVAQNDLKEMREEVELAEDNLEEMRVQLEDQEFKARTLEEENEKLERNAKLQAAGGVVVKQDAENLILLVSIDVSIPATTGHAGCDMNTQYLISLQGCQLDDSKVATVDLSATEDPNDQTTLNIRAVVNLPRGSADGTPLRHNIDFQLNNQTDHHGLRMSAQSSIVVLKDPLCIGTFYRSTAAAPGAESPTSLKRPHSQVAGVDGSSESEHPSKVHKV